MLYSHITIIQLYNNSKSPENNTSQNPSDSIIYFLFLFQSNYELRRQFIHIINKQMQLKTFKQIKRKQEMFFFIRSECICINQIYDLFSHVCKTQNEKLTSPVYTQDTECCTLLNNFAVDTVPKFTDNSRARLQTDTSCTINYYC